MSFPEIARAIACICALCIAVLAAYSIYCDFARPKSGTNPVPPPRPKPDTPEPTEETIWRAAQAIHNTGDITITVWPEWEGDDGRRVFEDGDIGHLRLCDDQTIEDFKAAARAAIQVYRNQR